MKKLSRRQFAGSLVASTATLAATPRLLAAENNNEVCVFTKPLQWLNYDQLSEKVAAMGFRGVEATVRPGGHVLPPRVREDLPRMVEALRRRELNVTIMTTAINRADDPTARAVLETAAKQGVKRFRMGYYRYDDAKPLQPQLREFGKMLSDLVALCDELGITPVYQNHSGRAYVGAPVWDLARLFEPFQPTQIGMAFDIRHATVEGGQTWPLHYRLMRPFIHVVYVKDFRWNGRKPENVPLGEGQVDPGFFKLIRREEFAGPISLHMEYIDHRDPKLINQSLAAIAADMKALRRLLG